MVKYTIRRTVHVTGMSGARNEYKTKLDGYVHSSRKPPMRRRQYLFITKLCTIYLWLIQPNYQYVNTV
jgi:hypothetical protein